MKGRKIKEKEGSAIVMYIQITSDILPKGKDIRNPYIPPNRNDMRNIADITKFSAIHPLFKNYKCSNRFCNIVWRNEEDNVNPKVNYRGDMRE